MKKVYFATPVNGRSEGSIREKKIAALRRCIKMREALTRKHPDWAVMFSFNVCPIDANLSEPEAMGRCVTLLMACDMIVVDNGWEGSKGCQAEVKVADTYGIPVLSVLQLFMANEL